MQDVINKLNELIEDFKLSKSYLKKVEKIKTKADTSVKEAEKKIAALKSQDVIDRSANSSRDLAVNAAPDIYIREVERAAARNTEFAHPSFITPLLDIADDPDLFTITYRGAGWNRRAVVYVNMDGVAGTIGEYARAVDDAREYMNVAKGDPAVASELWKSYYKNRRSVIDKTINIRLQFADSPAPFWSLLNYGNRVAMSSDRGGRPYPNMSGTRFVEKVQESIEEVFSENMMLFREQNRRDIESLSTGISEIKLLLEKIDRLIKGITDDVDNPKRYGNQIESTINKVESSSVELRKRTRSKALIEGIKSIGRALGSSLSRLLGLDE